MKHYVSSPLALPTTDGQLAPFERADLIFYGVDHSGPSYEARIFLNNGDAGFQTPCDTDNGYAGAFYVFGHGGCVGDEGHCDIDDRYEDEFDYRAPHPIQPWTKIVTVTHALRAAGGPEVRVTLIAVATGFAEARETDALHFEHLRLATYLGDAPEPSGRPNA
jgi:hypothetical protein